MFAPRVQKWLAGVACLACLCLAGCATQLYDNLDEAEANAVMAALIENGVDAEKRSGTEGSFSVFIDAADFARAVRTLDARALPGRRYDSLGRVFGKDAMFSTPMEEKARYLYALQEDLAHTLALVDGVLAARVHLVLPEQDQLGKEIQTPSAAVFVKHADDERHDPAAQRIEFRRLVAAAVPNLDEDRIVVSFTPAEARAPSAAAVPPPAWTAVWGIRVARESAGALQFLLGAAALACAGLAGAGFWMGRRSR